MSKAAEALHFYERALELSRRIADRSGEAATLNGVSLCYLDLGQLDQAISVLEQALAIQREIGDRRGELTTLYNWEKIRATIAVGLALMLARWLTGRLHVV